MLVLGVGWGIGTLVKGSSFEHGVDCPLASWFEHRGHGLDAVSGYVSDLANPFSTVIGTVVLALVLVLCTVCLARRPTRRRILALVFEPPLQLVLAHGIGRARPFAETQPCGHLIHEVGTEMQFTSFPSGHSAAAVVLFGVAAILVQQKWCGGPWARRSVAAAACLLAALVAASRVYRRVHFLSDVIGGVALGGAWLLITVYAFRLAVPSEAVGAGR